MVGKIIKLGLGAGFVWISGMWIAHGVAEELKEWNDKAEEVTDEQSIEVEFDMDKKSIFENHIDKYREFITEAKRYSKNLEAGKIQLTFKKGGES